MCGNGSGDTATASTTQIQTLTFAVVSICCRMHSRRPSLPILYIITLWRNDIYTALHTYKLRATTLPCVLHTLLWPCVLHPTSYNLQYIRIRVILNFYLPHFFHTHTHFQIKCDCAVFATLSNAQRKLKKMKWRSTLK